ncbi:hypothetical protein [Paraflavitalea speifideaquila]|uniref:hypothetical protein n=1 Tax=Paraflavitalea speifideaquila TaxID=3076558 RepID=UPI0028E8B85E|nr:hypothetical protein [Paraflavitalea speifideiaquila]
MKAESKKSHFRNSPIEMNDQYMVLHVKDSSFQPASFYYYFDERGKCNQEKTISFCDSCYTKYRDKLLARKQFEWVRINDTLYVSKFSKKRRLELHPHQPDRTMNLFKTSWKRPEYELLLSDNPFMPRF